MRSKKGYIFEFMSAYSFSMQITPLNKNQPKKLKKSIFWRLAAPKTPQNRHFGLNWTFSYINITILRHQSSQTMIACFLYMQITPLNKNQLKKTQKTNFWWLAAPKLPLALNVHFGLKWLILFINNKILSHLCPQNLIACFFFIQITPLNKTQLQKLKKKFFRQLAAPKTPKPPKTDILD